MLKALLFVLASFAVVTFGAQAQSLDVGPAIQTNYNLVQPHLSKEILIAKNANTWLGMKVASSENGWLPTKEASKWSVNVFGLSFHENPKTRHAGNQVNPGGGLRYRFSDNCYVEGNIIFRNTNMGRTKTLGVGCQGGITKLNDIPLRGGGQLMYMSYGDRNKNKTIAGIVPMPTLEYGHQEKISLVLGIFPKKKNSIFIAGLNVPF